MINVNVNIDQRYISDSCKEILGKFNIDYTLTDKIFKKSWNKVNKTKHPDKVPENQKSEASDNFTKISTCFDNAINEIFSSSNKNNPNYVSSKKSSNFIKRVQKDVVLFWLRYTMLALEYFKIYNNKKGIEWKLASIVFQVTYTMIFLTTLKLDTWMGRVDFIYTFFVTSYVFIDFYRLYKKDIEKNKEFTLKEKEILLEKLFKNSRTTTVLKSSLRKSSL
jgi:hypothetical protein